MTVNISSEINQQIALIRNEINEEKSRPLKILNATRHDLQRQYSHFIHELNVLPDATFGQIYILVAKRVEQLREYVREQINIMKANRIPGVPNDQGLTMLNWVNDTTRIIEDGNKAYDELNKVDKRIALVPWVFRPLANSLNMFSLSIVGIVARYVV